MDEQQALEKVTDMVVKYLSSVRLGVYMFGYATAYAGTSEWWKNSMVGVKATGEQMKTILTNIATNPDAYPACKKSVKVKCDGDSFFIEALLDREGRPVN